MGQEKSAKHALESFRKVIDDSSIRERQVKFVSADPDIVERLTRHLIKAFQDFMDSPEEVSHVDGMMAAHNFHCMVIFDLEREEEMSKEAVVLLRKVVVDTLLDRMRREPLP